MSLRLLDILLAGLALDRELGDAIVGDLFEERSARADRRGERAANQWLVGQVLRSIPMFASMGLRAGGAGAIGQALRAALVALVAVLAVGYAGAAVTYQTVPPDEAGRLMLLFLAIDIAMCAGGGYLAARLGRVSPFISAIAFALMAVLWSSWVHTMDAPSAAGLVLTATAGAWIRARQLAPGRERAVLDH